MTIAFSNHCLVSLGFSDIEDVCFLASSMFWPLGGYVA